MEMDPRPARVLFVDDEEPVLEGIRNALRRDRKRWDMVFAVGGEAALQELSRGQFDVIVSDMRMPGIDGATLLEKTRLLQPLTLRFVLSGHADREAIQRSQAVAHHFLSKPCEPVVLRGMLERATDLSRKIKSRALLDVIARLPGLPPTPEQLWPVSSTDLPADTRDIGGVLARDPSISDRFIRMSNTVFGMKSSIAEGDRAVSRLGSEIAGALVISAQVFAGFEALGVDAAFVDSIQNHSLLTAWLASSMLDEADDARAAFAAGLLHDVGRLALDLVYRGDPTGAHGAVLDDIDEEDRFGVTHAEISAHLAALWSLPLGVLEAVALHHHPPSLAGTFSVPWAVHLADALIHEAQGGRSDAVSAIQTQRTTVQFMTDLGERMTAARRQLMGHAEAREPGGFGR